MWETQIKLASDLQASTVNRDFRNLRRMRVKVA